MEEGTRELISKGPLILLIRLIIMTKSPPKHPTYKCHLIGIRFQHLNFEGHKFSDHSNEAKVSSEFLLFSNLLCSCGNGKDGKMQINRYFSI
jgi:hypothetical protein